MSRRKRSCSTRFSLFSFQDIITCLMGIMLLLTLLISLQITSSSSRSSAEVTTQSSRLKESVTSLQSELADLGSRVRSNAAILQSGGLSNTKLLQDKQRAAEAARISSERELFSMIQQSSDAVRSLSNLQSTAQSQQKMTTEEIAQLIAETQRQKDTLKDIQDGKRVVYNKYIGSADTCWIIEVTSDTDFKAAPIGKTQAPIAFTSINQVLNWTRDRHREGAEFLVLLKPGATNAIDRIPGTLREEGILHGYDLLGQEQTALDPVTGAEAL